MSRPPSAQELRAYLEQCWDRPVSFSDWLRVAAIAATLAVPACGGTVDGEQNSRGMGGTGATPSTGGTGGTGGSTGGYPGVGGTAYGIPFEMNCSDGLDNDSNGLADCADPYCNCGPAGGTGGVYGVPWEDCTDGRDNNYNGLVDCVDPSCYSDWACQATGGVGGAYAMPMFENCSNGMDDDWDTYVDCADPDCYGSVDCVGPGGAAGQPSTGGTGGFVPPLGGTGGLYAVPF